jgi:hypothetical protein
MSDGPLAQARGSDPVDRRGRESRAGQDRGRPWHRAAIPLDRHGYDSSFPRWQNDSISTMTGLFQYRDCRDVAGFFEEARGDLVVILSLLKEALDGEKTGLIAGWPNRLWTMRLGELVGGPRDTAALFSRVPAHGQGRLRPRSNPVFPSLSRCDSVTRGRGCRRPSGLREAQR